MKRIIPWSMVILRALMGPGIILLTGSTHPAGSSPSSWSPCCSTTSSTASSPAAGTPTPPPSAAQTPSPTPSSTSASSALSALRIPHVLRTNAALLIALLSAELIKHIFDRIKFRRGVAYHSYLSKTWGLVMALSVVAALITARGGWWIPLSLVMGIAANLEGIAISATLPRWKNDIKTLAVALRLRREMLARTQASSTNPPTDKLRTYAQLVGQSDS